MPARALQLSTASLNKHTNWATQWGPDSSALKRGNNRVDDNISSLVALLSDADKETMLNLAKVLFEKTR